MPYTLSTKFFLPEPVPGAVARPHLLARLDDASDSKLTTICAPAGFGKTTLAATWLRSLVARSGEGDAPTRVAWYSLDATDNDLATFVARLVAALRHAEPDFLPDWMDLNRRPIVPRPDYLAAELALSSRTPGRLVLALEDYHLIVEPSIHTLLTEWIRLLPSNLRLVILSRYDPPVGLARLRAHGEVTELHAPDLAFSQTEATDLLQAIVGEALDLETVQVLWEQTEGWLVGLRLAGLSLQKAAERPMFLANFRRHGIRHIGDYLMDEVLRRQPTEVEDFLLRTSILSRLSGPLCASVAGIDRPAGQALLEHIVAQDLFVSPLDDYGGWYRYHAQFQTLLSQRLPARLGEREVADLHRRAATWLSEQGLLDEALKHYIAAGEATAAARLVEAHAPKLAHNQAWSQLNQWLSLLPDELTETRPGLLLARAWLFYARSAWSRIRPLVERAEALLPARPAGSGDAPDALWGQVYALRSTVIFPTTSREAKIEQGREALRLLPPEYTRARATALNYLGRWLNAAGRPEEARRLIEDELVSVGMSDAYYTIRMYYTLCVLEYFAADLDRYESVTRRFRDLAYQANQPIDQMWAEFILARILLERNQADTARHHLETLFARPNWASFQALLMGAYLLLPLHAERGEMDRGAVMLRVLRERLVEAPDEHSRREVEALEAYWALLVGDIASAAAWVGATERHPSTEHESRRGFIRARILLGLGEMSSLVEAVDVLEYLLDRYENMHYTPEQVQTLTFLARVQWLLRQREAALASLRTAITLGYPRGYRRAFTQHGPTMREMLITLAQESRFAEASGVLTLALAETQPAVEHSLRTSGDAALLLIEPLTPRELQILEGLERGLTNKEIARLLHLSPQTIRNHTVNIYAKLQVDNRRLAVARARKIGLLTTG
ncbi:MAG: LuxR C-terminal-related transcriptional regulator [Anaerolineae bacterium]